MNRGPFLMVLATLVLTCMSGAVKVARAELDTLDIVVWRSIFAIPFAWWWARGADFRIEKKGLLGIRVGLGFAAMICFFTALKGLPLADTNMVTKLQPVLIALGAPLFLGRSEQAEAMVLAAGGAGWNSDSNRARPTYRERVGPLGHRFERVLGRCAHCAPGPEE